MPLTTGANVFCAKDDGSVCVYSTETGSNVQELFQHAEHIAVSLLVWDADNNFLASADLSSRFMVRKITIRRSGRWQVDEPFIDRRSDYSIHEILLRPAGNRLLLSTSACDYLWDETGKSVAVYEPRNRGHWSWLTHPKDSDHLVLFEDKEARIFHWSSLQELNPTAHVSLMVGSFRDDALSKARIADRGGLFILEHSGVDRTSALRRITIWSADQLKETAQDLQCQASFLKVASEMLSVVGTYGACLVFLNHLHWFCTLDLRDTMDKSYVRHFFIPPEWYSSTRQLNCCVTSKGDIVIVQEEEIIIIKRGMTLQNTVYLD